MTSMTNEEITAALNDSGPGWRHIPEGAGGLAAIGDRWVYATEEWVIALRPPTGPFRPWSITWGDSDGGHLRWACPDPREAIVVAVQFRALAITATGLRCDGPHQARGET